MATCQQCGMQLDQGDRFCMGCGTPQPALSSPGEQISDPRAAGGGAKFRPATTPTWLPADPPPASAQPQPPVPGALPAAAPGAAGAQPTPGNGVACPRCSAQLPAGARFCGDCGKQLDGTSGAAAAQAAVPPVMAPPNPFSAPLATPIPPFTPPPTPLPAAPAQSVLPAFRPGGWADASIPPPEGGPADQSWLAAPTFGNTALPRAIGQAATGQAASGHLPVSAVPWPADPASAGPTNTAPTPIGGLVLPLAPPPFQPQWLAAGPGGPGFPPGQPNPGGRAQPGKRKHPRSQVITMLVAGIISLVFGIAGVVAQVLLNK